jgi:hypothetical protein
VYRLWLRVESRGRLDRQRFLSKSCPSGSVVQRGRSPTTAAFSAPQDMTRGFFSFLWGPLSASDAVRDIPHMCAMSSSLTTGDLSIRPHGTCHQRPKSPLCNTGDTSTASVSIVRGSCWCPVCVRIDRPHSESVVFAESEVSVHTPS